MWVSGGARSNAMRSPSSTDWRRNVSGSEKCHSFGQVRAAVGREAPSVIGPVDLIQLIPPRCQMRTPLPYQVKHLVLCGAEYRGSVCCFVLAGTDAVYVATREARAYWHTYQSTWMR
eukprot:1270052-Rhodomonas_salina.2